MTFGADRLLFPVDYPFGNNSEAVACFENLPVSPEDREKTHYSGWCLAKKDDVRSHRGHRVGQQAPASSPGLTRFSVEWLLRPHLNRGFS
jgi:hypothetical protein